ncbi:hypothetical protein Q6283_29555, partial [Klebsiella pneumoniae]|uniref:hypothetical protein n=1 Tax=Klebsiella pneumoniae TaxID=573 RepID=UPI0027305443
IVAPSDPVTPGYYNGHLTLEVEWGDGQALGIPIPSYDPILDLPQSPEPAIHGRYSGQWVASGLPRTGLVLQIGEIGPSRN